MRKVFFFLFFLAITIQVKPQLKHELRAAWLTNVDSNVLFSDQAITEAMDYLASAGFNVVFPVVYNKGYTLYPSKVMQNNFNASVLPGSAFINRDFLERIIIEAHRVGIEVIPWFEFGFSTSYSLNGGHIIAKFPKWALKDRDGKLVVKNGFDWMSAINPQAQDFMLSLITEVIDKYDVDGIQGDDRLPAMPVEGGYDSTTVAIYKSENNGNVPPNDIYNSTWMRWRANKLNQYQTKIRDSVKARSKNLIVSSSPTPFYWGYNSYLQDSKTWALQGLVDNIIPQLYQYNTSDYNYALNTTWNDFGSQSSKIFTPGILMKVGSYHVDSTFLGQMLKANRAKGTNGESYFFYEGLRANNNLLGNYLKRNFYSQSALPPYRNGVVWRPKGIIVNETDTDVSKTGNWESYLMKGYQGTILRTSDNNSVASISYTLKIPNTAYYDIYAYQVPNIIWTKKANYTIHSTRGNFNSVVDQTDANKKGWVKIGTAYLVAGNQKVVTVDNTQIESGSYLIADALMLLLNRKLSPEVIVSVKKNESSSQIPKTFKLLDNFPNPFNPETNINFHLSASSHVSLIIFDILGQEITTLVDGFLQAGIHSKRFFHSHSLPSGVYFYKLKATPFSDPLNSYSEVKKMILIK